MRERIAETLKKIEQENDCKILFACESGSRAWGFASPDSDYDVRFIYTKPLAWHLLLEQRHDTIEKMTPDNLDLSGWELGKALRLFAGCNLGLNEWLGSPEIYYADPAFHASLREMIVPYFNPRKALYHYLSTAEKTADQELQGEKAKIKKIFYVLRPLLACQWVLDRQTMPPTLFDHLLAQPLAPDLSAEIQELLARKAQAVEGERVPVPPLLSRWIAQTREFVHDRAVHFPVSPAHGWEALNDLMRRYVLPG